MPSAESLVAARGESLHEHRKATRKMRWWYESLADYMVANPSATQNEIAAHFGRQPCTISTIVNTDAFKAYFRQRRQAHVERLDEGVRDRLFKVTEKSLDHILEVLDKKRDTIPLEMLQRVADSSLKNLGYGVTPPASQTVNVNTAPQQVHVAVSLSDLELARAALRRQQSMTVDVPPALAGSGDRRPALAGAETSLPTLTFREMTDAEEVRSDPGSGDERGVVSEAGEAKGRPDLQRFA